MDPFIGIASSAKVAKGRFSFEIILQLTSVLAPGITVIAEVYFLYLQVTKTRSNGTAQLNAISTFLIGILILAVGYMIGQVIRELGFRVLGYVERFPRFQEQLTSHSFGRISKYLDEDTEREFKEMHPYFKFLEAQSKLNSEGEGVIGGYHTHTSHYEEFVYAKMWLRNYGAGFNVDGGEITINILASTLIPIAVASADLSAMLKFSWWSIFLGISTALLAWTFVINSLMRMRRAERGDSIRYITFDYYMKKAAARYLLDDFGSRDGGDTAVGRESEDENGSTDPGV